MTKQEMDVLKSLLFIATDMMSDRMCNDVEHETESLMSKEQWIELFKEMKVANGETEPYDDENYLGYNWWVLEHLFKKAMKEVAND